MFKGLLNNLQKLGKSLMVPIAVLPAAAIFLRLGSADLLGIPFIEAAGSAVFGNLPILFAIGVAFGLSKDKHGAAGLAGAVSYFIITATALAINPDNKLGHLAGIIAGCLAGWAYNRFNNVKLPDWLGFFGGRRFVPIVSGGFSIAIGGALGYVYPAIQRGISGLSNLIESAPLGVGEFIQGVTNRALLPFGLHHILNTYVNNFLGEWNGITGDLNRFFAQIPSQGLMDPTAGRFGVGGFIIDMFALPALVLAMYLCVSKEKRKSVMGAYLSIALTAMITGITEPVEFLFMFTAPLLYVFHTFMFGAVGAVGSMMGVRHRETFSSGLIDYLLNYNLSTKAWLIIPLGIVTAVIYFFVFKWAIQKFNIPIPGRDDSESAVSLSVLMKSQSLDQIAAGYVEKLGGKNNIIMLESCITRLRMKLKNTSVVNDDELKALGAGGVIRMGSEAMQVVVGTQAEQLSDAIQKYL